MFLIRLHQPRLDAEELTTGSAFVSSMPDLLPKCDAIGTDRATGADRRPRIRSPKAESDSLPKTAGAAVHRRTSRSLQQDDLSVGLGFVLLKKIP